MIKRLVSKEDYTLHQPVILYHPSTDHAFLANYSLDKPRRKDFDKLPPPGSHTGFA